MCPVLLGDIMKLIAIRSDTFLLSGYSLKALGTMSQGKKKKFIWHQLIKNGFFLFQVRLFIISYQVTFTQ